MSLSENSEAGFAWNIHQLGGYEKVTHNPLSHSIIFRIYASCQSCHVPVLGTTCKRNKSRASISLSLVYFFSLLCARAFSPRFNCTASSSPVKSRDGERWKRHKKCMCVCVCVCACLGVGKIMQDRGARAFKILRHASRPFGQKGRWLLATGCVACVCTYI